MIYILNREEKVIGLLHNNTDRGNSNIYFDDLHSEDLTTGAETFSFCSFTDREMSSALTVGNYIAFKKNNSYRLMQIIETEEDKEEVLVKNVYCETVGLELLNSIYDGNIMENVNIGSFLDTVLQDTHWKVGYIDSNLTDNLALEIEPKEVYSLIQEHIGAFGAEIQFRVEIKNNRVVGRYIDAFAKRGNNNGRRLEIHRDIKKIVRKIDLSNYATKLIGVGKDNLSFKDVAISGIDKPLGQNFIVDEDAYERLNYKGSHITRKFEYDTTDAIELLRQTKKALEEMSKPQITYEIDTNLMDFDDIEIGDTIIVSDTSFEPPLTITTRVGILETSKSDKSKNKAVLTNFKEIKSGISRFPISGNDILNGAITGDKIDSGYTEGVISDSVNASTVVTNKLIANHAEIVTAKIDSLIAQDAIIGELVAGKADIEDLNATNATIENLNANKADIGELNAIKGTINSLESEIADIGLLKADVADIEDLLAGNITAENIQTGTITAGSGIIADGAIGNAQISSIDAGKISAGKIDTSKVEVVGADGHLRIKGNRMQVFQGTGNQAVERVSIGDVKGDGSVYGLRVRGVDGQTILLDENGVTSEGITDGSITNEKISDDAEIDGAKININSVISKINEDGTETINGTKIEVDGTNLNTKLSTMTIKQNEDSERITQAQSQITANTESIKLKVDEQTYITDKQGTQTSLNKHTSEINTLKDEIKLKVERTDVEQVVNELSNEIVDSKIETAKSEIKLTTDAISQSVSNLSQEIDTKADGSTITDINNRVSSLETDVDGITSSVSSLQNKTTSIDGKVVSLETWKKSAEQKITDDAIISTVSSTIDKKVSDGVANVNDKITVQESTISEIKQTSNSISQKVTDLNGKYTEIKQTVDGLDLTGVVKFNDLSSAGQTVINGANITTGYISGNRIRGGVISATDEINFVGGARIFGNAGSFEAGLKISAQEYLFNSGDAYFESDMYAKKNLIVSGNITNTTGTFYGRRIELTNDAVLKGTTYFGTGSYYATSAGALKVNSITTNSFNTTSSSIGTVSTNRIDVYGHSNLDGNMYVSGTGTIVGALNVKNQPIYGMGSIALARGTIYLPQGGGNNTTDYLRIGGGFMAGVSSGNFHFLTSGGSTSSIYARNVVSGYSLAPSLISDVSALDKISEINVVNTSEGFRLVAPINRSLDENQVVTMSYNEKTNQEEIQVDFNSAISTLWKAVQELKQENEELKKLIKGELNND